MKKYLFILISVSCFGQFNPVQWYEFGSGNYEHNTFIGGIGGTINTRELLAAKLGINVNSIKKFEVVGSDIQCAMSQKYSVDGFNNNTEITYYIDTEEKITNIGAQAFRGCVSFTGNINFKGVLGMDNSSYFMRQTPIPNIYLENCATVGDAVFYNGDAPAVTRNIYIPKCTNLGNTSGFDSVFYLIEPGSTITVNIVLQTNNGGLPDGDLVYAISQGATVIYVP